MPNFGEKKISSILKSDKFQGYFPNFCWNIHFSRRRGSREAWLTSLATAVLLSEPGQLSWGRKFVIYLEEDFS